MLRIVKKELEVGVHALLVQVVFGVLPLPRADPSCFLSSPSSALVAPLECDRLQGQALKPLLPPR